MHLLEDGYSIEFIHKKYGIDKSRLKRLWIQYQQEGKNALVRKTPIRSDGVLKEKIVRDYLENHLSLVEISLKYNVSENRLLVWCKIVKEQGYAALYAPDRRGRPPKDMGRPKKKEPQTELEKLQKEVARLREIGRKPSKN